MYKPNIVIHNYPGSPYVAKAAVNYRNGSKILYSFCLRDVDVARSYVEKHFCDVSVKVITHNINMEA